MPGSTKASFSDDGVSMTFTVVGYYDYDKPREPAAMPTGLAMPSWPTSGSTRTCTTTTAPLPHDVEISYNGVTIGPDVCDALFALGQRIRQEGGKTEAAFAEQAARYRALAVKPALSEDLRRLVVQAESHRQRKDYSRAIELFRQALRTNPTAYPAAWFNLAPKLCARHRCDEEIPGAGTRRQGRPCSPGQDLRVGRAGGREISRTQACP